MIPRVKICGITSVDDALWAVEAGADALGLMFYEKSPRAVKWDRAREIVEVLPPWVSTVGVYVNPRREEVMEGIERVGLNGIQFHGDETPEFCSSFSNFKQVKVLRAFRINNSASLDRLRDFEVDGWLLDSYVKGLMGGTGETFNWDLAVEAVGWKRCPVILAGGLNPGNVRGAVEKTRPFGVDVSSGVEISPGKKGFELMRDFVREVKGMGN